MERLDRADVVAAQYVAGVRERLADLPPGEVSELVEDVREHLNQVAAEFGDAASMAALTDRLGPPAQYADDLRASAGYPPPGTPPQRAGFVRRLSRFVAAVFGWVAAGLAVMAVLDAFFGFHRPEPLLVTAAVCAVVAGALLLLLVARHPDPRAELAQLPGMGLLAEAMWWVRSKPWSRPAIEYLASLRPAWWAARAAVVALVVALTTTISLGAVTFLVALVASVWLGRRADAGEIDGRGRLAVHGANIGLAFTAVLVCASLAASAATPQADYVSYSEDDHYYDPYAPMGGYVDYVHEDLADVTNIFPYGPDGTLLHDIRLFDQNGRPIELSMAYCEDYENFVDHADDAYALPSPWGTHVYPRLSVVHDDSGRCREPQLLPPHGPRLPGTPAAADGATLDGATAPEPEDPTGTK